MVVYGINVMRVAGFYAVNNDTVEPRKYSGIVSLHYAVAYFEQHARMVQGKKGLGLP